MKALQRHRKVTHAHSEGKAMTTDETPVTQIGVDLEHRLTKRLGEIGDTFTLIGLAYLEGMHDRSDERERGDE